MKRRLALAALLLVGASCGLVDRGDVAGEPAAPSPLPTTAAPELRFAVIGDFGTGLQVQHEVADRMCRWRSNHPFDLVITTGDNVYDHGHPDDFPSKFFRPYRCLLDDGVRFRAALGNHDVATDNGRPELEEPAFGMKARNYVVRRGGVRFLIADSNNLKRWWLRRKLDRQTDDRWTIVVLHHPVVSGGAGHGSTPGFDDLVGLFGRKGVDLVLQGHDHMYSVSRPLDGGVRYVVTGGGGARLYDCAAERPEIARCVKRYHFLYVRATDEAIIVKAVPRRGPVFHRLEVR